jgi:hypothetical protein
MRALVLCLALLAGIAGAGALGLHLTGERGAQEPAYPVGALVARLETQAVPWAGRTVVLLGRLEPCPWAAPAARTRYCAGQPLVLAAMRGSGVLPVVDSAGPTWLARAQAIPLLGMLVPEAPALPLFTPLRATAVLELLPAASCRRAHCYRARLLHAQAVPPARLVPASRPGPPSSSPPRRTGAARPPYPVKRAQPNGERTLLAALARRHDHARHRDRLPDRKDIDLHQ